jgi:hypothetical protein
MWEYLIINENQLQEVGDQLNALGAQSWELIAVQESRIFLKRPKSVVQMHKHNQP